MPRSQSKSSHKPSSHSSSKSSSQQDYIRPMSYTGAVLPRPPTTPIPSMQPPTQSSFGQIVKEGFAFGIGSSIAQRIFGPSKQVVHVPQTTPIETIPTGTLSKEIQEKPDQQLYNQCILEGGTEEVCKQYRIESI